jgi:hypothetical protein
MKRKLNRGWIIAGSLALLALASGLGLLLALTHRPAFYRQLTESTADRVHRQAEAARFVKHSTRLRNDIANEPRWEAAFTDEEVNAWLAEDLVTHFADQLPAGVRDPRVLFEEDRITLAFTMSEGPVPSVVWVVLRVAVPRENELALTVEKIRAGALPISPSGLLDRISRHARERGVDLAWSEVDGLPVATVRYTTDPERRDIVLEGLEISEGKIRLSGRSDRARGEIASPTLPGRRVLQSTFPKKASQAAGADVSRLSPPASAARSRSGTRKL